MKNRSRVCRVQIDDLAARVDLQRKTLDVVGGGMVAYRTWKCRANTEVTASAGRTGNPCGLAQVLQVGEDFAYQEMETADLQPDARRPFGEVLSVGRLAQRQQMQKCAYVPVLPAHNFYCFVDLGRLIEGEREGARYLGTVCGRITQEDGMNTAFRQFFGDSGRYARLIVGNNNGACGCDCRCS